MFKRLEEKWNSKTPVYLHNHTWQNLVFQIGLLGLLLGGMAGYSRIQERRLTKKRLHVVH